MNKFHISLSDPHKYGSKCLDCGYIDSSVKSVKIKRICDTSNESTDIN